MSCALRFSALLGSHPLGFLASLGLLRKLGEWDEDSKLAFRMEDDWVAVGHTRAVCDIDELIDKLADWVGSEVFDRLLNWADDVRVPPGDYRHRVVSAVTDGDLVLAGFLSAMAADGAADGQKGLVKPSAFYMASGQQSFLGGMREVLRLVRASPHAAFKEALVGPWRYRMRVHSLGWDPNTERLHALRHRAPTSEKPVCIGGAVVLAFWALPLFPAVAVRGRCSTIGFTRENGEQYFTWPVWTIPATFDEVTSLIHSGEAAWIDQRTGRARPGLTAIYRSRRAEFGQGYAVLRAPQVSSRARRVNLSESDRLPS